MPGRRYFNISRLEDILKTWDTDSNLDANIRITNGEVERLGRPSVASSDRSGDYFGTLGEQNPKMREKLTTYVCGRCLLISSIACCVPP